jgi:hypothetical protein
MFTIKNPDSFALQKAEIINSIGADMLSSMSRSIKNGFRELFFDGETVRPKEDIRRVLSAFERPAELFDKHAAAVAFLLALAPDSLAPEDYTPPVPHVINEDGTVTIPD